MLAVGWKWPSLKLVINIILLCSFVHGRYTVCGVPLVIHVCTCTCTCTCVLFQIIQVNEKFCELEKGIAEKAQETRSGTYVLEA